MYPFHPSLDGKFRTSDRQCSPCRHERQHDQRVSKRVVILEPGVRVLSNLGQAKYLEIQDRVEDEQCRPKQEQVGDRGQARSDPSVKLFGLVNQHCGLKQLVEGCDPLHEFKRNRDQKQLLQLDVDLIARLTLDGGLQRRDRRRETAGDDDKVEDVPSVTTKALKAEPVTANAQVDCVRN